MHIYIYTCMYIILYETGQKHVPYFWENLDATLTPWLLASPWVWCRKPQLLSWWRPGKPPGWGPFWGPKWAQHGPNMAQHGHLNDIWMGQWWFSDGFFCGLSSFFRPQLNHEAYLNVFSSMDCVSSPCLQAGFFSTQRVDILGELTAWISWRKDIRLSLVELSFGVTGMAHGAFFAHRKGAAIRWVKLGWLVQIRLVRTNLVTKKTTGSSSCHIMSRSIFVHFWGDIIQESRPSKIREHPHPPLGPY